MSTQVEGTVDLRAEGSPVITVVVLAVGLAAAGLLWLRGPLPATVFAALGLGAAATLGRVVQRRRLGRASGGALVHMPPAPEGTSLVPMSLAYATLLVPGWRVEHQDGLTRLHGEGGLTLTIQGHDRVRSSDLGGVLTAYEDAVRKDRPGWQRRRLTVGTVRDCRAARVEGGCTKSPYVMTRDYLVFSRGKLVVVQCHAPSILVTRLGPLVDFVVSSLRIR